MAGEGLEKFHVSGLENIRKSMDRAMDCPREGTSVKEMSSTPEPSDCNATQNYFHFLPLKLISDF